MMKKRDLRSCFELLEAGFHPSGVELVGIAKHAIERAIKAEELARELVEALEEALDNVVWELVEQEHLLNRAKEVLGDGEVR